MSKTSKQFTLLAAAAICCCLFGQTHAEKPNEKSKPLTQEQAGQLFTARIFPLLKTKCFACHGDDPKEIRGEFDIRSRAGMLKGGESGETSLVPGKPEKSPIYLSVKWDGLEMPPKENDRLTAEQIEWIRQWIAGGAPWVEPDFTKPSTKNTFADPNSVVMSTSGGLDPGWTNRVYKAEDVWAFQPIKRYEVPWDAIKKSKTKNPIDAFIVRKLQSQKLQPTNCADKRTLLRRITFQLTGLPPTVFEIVLFEIDESPRAFQKVVNRLLSSKHYGEQMAGHWLDVVRYADTGGFSNDYERPNAWRYRDYVIRSFNTDKPYDQFIVEQIAGDELDPNDAECRIAVGFLRMGPWEHTGMSVATITRQLFLDDITHGVGVSFLAQGLRCARCHDHKFDPLPTRDYYRMQSAFAPVQFADVNVDYQPYENTSNFEEIKQRSERLLKDSQETMARLSKKSNDAIAQFLKKRGVKKLTDLPPDERPKKTFYGLTALEKSIRKIYNKRISYFEREMKRFEPFAFSVYNGPPNGFSSNKPTFLIPSAQNRKGRVQQVNILIGGALNATAELVTPGVLSAMHGSNDAVSPTAWNTIPNSMQGRRLALAKWIASPSNTLTARVMVNRIWQIHFGQGLVATSNSFGKMGAKPSHPELLDWLANWFIEHGWSVKKLQRLIVSSNTYQQQSSHPEVEKCKTVDPNNELLAYYNARRLTAEEIRDSALAAAGELNREMGGLGVFPEINWEVAKQPRHIMGSVAPAYQPSRLPEQRNRRTIYTFKFRTLPDPMLEVFNKPTSDISCERRSETTVTPQVFALFNGQFTHDRALALANKITKSTNNVPDQINAAFQQVFGRSPSGEEQKLAASHLAEMLAHHRQRKPTVVPPPLVVTRAMIEELTGEEYTWDEELDLMKDYVSDLKPWDVDPETRALAELCLVLLNSNEFVYLR